MKWMVLALIGIVLFGGLWFFGNFLFLAVKPFLEEVGVMTPPSPQQAEQEEKARGPVGKIEPFGPATLMVSPRKQQAIGVRSTTVQVRSLVRTMRTVGLVEVDERLLSHVHIKLQGWIEKLYVQFKGEKVQKDQMLFEIYSPDLVATQDEYLSWRSKQ
jgi:Cu(I)/Ag(I) efflux system membrane fusion protein